MTLIALLVLLVTAAPAHAVRKPVIGIGEQKVGMFDDPRWQSLDLRHVRYIAPWDALNDPRQRRLLDDWMAAARKADARVLLGVVGGRRAPRRPPPPPGGARDNPSPTGARR
jgi:hypothetical protein